MKIPIINEQDEVIGLEERSIIHKNGIKHREIHVWLVTPEKKFIFQKRGMHQDTWPGFLDVTVGGHVDTATESYEDCAKRELEEETGISVPLYLITKKYSESYDPNTDTHNNVFRATYAGIFSGELSDLKIEEGAGLGFELFSLTELSNLTEESKKKFIPRFFDISYTPMYESILKTLFA